jgi:hypothetical protein
MNLSDFCATCGRRRLSLEIARPHWSFTKLKNVARSEETGAKPWQGLNDLSIHMSISRNGGTSSECHLCNLCLIAGLAVAKIEIMEALEQNSQGIDLIRLVAQLSDRLAKAEFINDFVDAFGKHGVPFHARNQTAFMEAVSKLWSKYVADNSEPYSKT